MRIIAKYPSRTYGHGHEIWEHDSGELSCSCPATHDCWALQKEKGRKELDKILNVKRELKGLPTVQEEVKRIEAGNVASRELAYASLKAERMIYEACDIELLKANNARSLALHAVTVINMQERALDAYYLRFV